MMTLTYPRTGSHYIRQLLVQKLGTRVAASHNWDDAKGLVITIARDPYDSLQSYITMSSHYDQPIGIKTQINSYAFLYRFLYNRANVVVDYNTLVKNPDKVVDALSDILDKPVSDHPYEQNMVDKPEENYLVSSTTSELYKQNYLEDFDLSDAYKAYHLLLSRKTI